MAKAAREWRRRALILGTRALCILPSRPALATDRAMEAQQTEQRGCLRTWRLPAAAPSLMGGARRQSNRRGTTRGFGRCLVGGVLLLTAEAAARSDTPGEAGRPMAGRPVERG